jgi:hypothetical protein
MKLGKFNQEDSERKRYTIDYADWLDTGETVTESEFVATPATTPPLVVDDVAITGDGTKVQFYVSGGLAPTLYTVEVATTTTGAQIKIDEVLYNIKD